GKLVIAHDNEIINNPINTENLLKASSIAERIMNLVKLPKFDFNKLNPANNGSIIVQFGDVYGATPQQADNFANRFISTVKRKGGNI
ncbi:hypothetical protein D7X33_52880, partial [Butyricicoccus sp. 1XD8-22]